MDDGGDLLEIVPDLELVLIAEGREETTDEESWRECDELGVISIVAEAPVILND